MSKTRIDPNVFLYPMPMTIVGAYVEGRPNFLAVAWAARVNHDPPMIAVALGKSHHTNAGIVENGAFSVNIPGTSMIEETDYVGLVSGKKTDKSSVFDLFYGDLDKAPMISRCPLCMECRLSRTVDLPSNTLFIGDIVGAYAEESALTGGDPDMEKIEPFTLSMPDNSYWAVGERVGKAWSEGRKHGKKRG